MAHRNDTTTPRPRRSGPWPLCALVIGALAVVTACGADTGDNSSTGAPDGGEPAASSVTAAHTGRTAPVPPASRAASSHAESSHEESSHPVTHSASATVANSGSASRSGARRACSTDQLRLALGRKDVGAGNVYMPLVLTNKSTGTCTLTGFPGVSLLDSAGSAIGDPATRRGASSSGVSLSPGGSASAMLHTLNVGTSDKPCRRTPARIRAYPPDSFTSMTVPTRSFRVCGDVFEVEAVYSGKGA